MGCTGKDEGLRPVHLVIVRVCMSRLLEVPGCPTDLIAGLAIAFARDHLIEFSDALALVQHLNATRLLPSIASGTDHGFRAACHPHALRTLVAALLTNGVAISPNGLLSDGLLAAAEREAIDMHSSDMMHSSTVKSIRGGGNTHTATTTRYTDPGSRGDVIRWLDGTDGRAPACAALTQWLRGQLMSAVREACEAAPPHSYTGSGRAPRLLLDHSNVLPISMLACYPGGGTRFKRHVDNSPEAPDLRAVTAVLYLNGHWREEDGGTLRIYNTGGDDPQQSTTTFNLLLFISTY